MSSEIICYGVLAHEYFVLKYIYSLLTRSEFYIHLYCCLKEEKEIY